MIQDEFDLAIGRLDRILSVLLCWVRGETLDHPNKQTAKHHAEDMVAAGNAILKKLSEDKIEGAPQPPPKFAPTTRAWRKCNFLAVLEHAKNREVESVSERKEERVFFTDGTAIDCCRFSSTWEIYS